MNPGSGTHSLRAAGSVLIRALIYLTQRRSASTIRQRGRPDAREVYFFTLVEGRGSFIQGRHGRTLLQGVRPFIASSKQAFTAFQQAFTHIQ